MDPPLPAQAGAPSSGTSNYFDTVPSTRGAGSGYHRAASSLPDRPPPRLSDDSSGLNYYIPNIPQLERVEIRQYHKYPTQLEVSFVFASSEGDAPRSTSSKFIIDLDNLSWIDESGDPIAARWHILGKPEGETEWQGQNNANLYDEGYETNDAGDEQPTDHDDAGEEQPTDHDDAGEEQPTDHGDADAGGVNIGAEVGDPDVAVPGAWD